MLLYHNSVAKSQLNKNALNNVHYIERKTKEANISLSKLYLTLPIQKLNSPKQ